MKIKNICILKPLLAIFLTTALLFGIMPIAYAADFSAGTPGELTTALASAADGDTIYLTADIDYDNGIVIQDKDITLDVQGFTLNVTNASGIGLDASNGGVALAGTGSFNVTGTSGGVNATLGSEVTVTSATSTVTENVYGVYASGGSTVHVQDDVTGYAGVYAAVGLPSTVTVGGDVDAFGGGCGFGVYAADGSQISVSGDIYSSLADAGVYADGSNSYIHAGGVVVASGTCGAWADNGGRVLVDGNIQGGAVGIGAGNSGVAEASADVTANGAGGVGAEAQSGGQVTVRGLITADIYTKVDLVGKTISETTSPTTWLGYATYSESSLSVIWVRASNYEFSANPSSISPEGGDSVITLSGIDLPPGITITAFDGAMPALTGTTAGTDTTQTVTLTFPENTSTTDDKIYTLLASQDGGTSWETGLVAEVTVRKVFTGPAIIVPTPPTVTTDAVSGITSSSATLNGEVTDDGHAAVTGRGFVYGLSADPDINDTDITQMPVNGDIGAFTASITGLSSGAAYHVSAYAINSVGTSYGADMAFTTLPVGGDEDDEDEKGGESGSSFAPASYRAVVTKNKVQVETLPVAVASGTGTVSLTGPKAAEFFTAGGEIVILMPSIPRVSRYSLEMPANSLSGTQAANSLTFETPSGSITIPNDMLPALSGTKNKIAGISISQGDKAAIGDRPLIELILTLDGAAAAWNNPAAPVAVSIPYTPAAAELADPESIVIWYLDGSGKPACIPNGHYKAATGTVTFTAVRFGLYAAGYNPVRFGDVAENAQYSKAVSFIAARGVTAGTDGGNYRPAAKLTRGECLVMLMRSYEIAPDIDPTDNFADAENTYYANYMKAAKRLGISSGVGGNLFEPDREITRQEMFTLLYNTLRVFGTLPTGTLDKTLSDYSDADQIAPWALEAMRRLVEAGIVDGSGGRLYPEDTYTRAEMAQFLYNLLMR